MSKKEMGFVLGGTPNEDQTRDNRTQEEINNEEKIAQKRYIEKSKTFGDNRSDEEILGSLKVLRSAMNDYVREVLSKNKSGESLPEFFEAQWLDKIKTISPVFYEYYADECGNDPSLLSLESKGRKFLISNLLNRFLNE